MKIINNKMTGRVYDELKSNITRGSKLSVISAYFTIYGYASLKKELNSIDNMRFLFTEPTFVQNSNEVSREFCIDHEKAITGNQFEIKLRNEMKQSQIAKECADWIKNKVEVRSLKKSNPAQPRMIYIDNGGEKNAVIHGTVDFTTDGFGITPSDRIDYNTYIEGPFTVDFLRLFDQIWNDSAAVEDVKEGILNHMKTIYKENSPEFIYYFTLYNIFYEYLDELSEEKIVRSGINLDHSTIWNKLYRFQKDGVMGIIDKIEKYNGCILADSVGLGKTFTALAVIKYYQSRNDRVLVLCPKKLRDNWTIYTANDRRNIFVNDRFNYDVLSHTDLSRTSGMSGDINLATVNWGNYDLVVIDESHNFRNDPPFKGHITRYQRLMRDIIRQGVKTKVLMLSATPVNNNLSDIKNQIMFITEGDTKALAEAGIPSIDVTISGAQRAFNKWSGLPDDERNTDRFVETMPPDYFKLLDTLTIARSRKHIEKYYNLEDIGKFPERLPPKNIYSKIDLYNEFPSISEVNTLLNRLNLSVYSPMAYILPDKVAHYEEMYDIMPSGGRSVLKQSSRERNLVTLMRVNILKRLESSIHSFQMTIDKVLGNVKDTLRRINNLDSTISEADVSDLDLDDPEIDSMSFGSRVKINLRDMDLVKWHQDLEEDVIRLEQISMEAKKVTPDRDAKLRDLRVLMLDKIENPINGSNRKIIVFTAFADTAFYLYENLKDTFSKLGMDSAIITGTGDNRSTISIPASLRNLVKVSDLSTVLTLFSPKSKEKATVFPEFDGEIDIMFCTDCISEGQNLQDCDYLVDYDIHWNPVRIIQRFGRIDRIGSTNDVIQLVNFWPMRDLDEYINLQRRVRGRMILADVSATGEENVIEQNSQMRDLEYRKKQLQRLQEEVVDLEDVKGGVSITDMTFTDFKTDLMYFLKEHRDILDKTPLGLHAVTRSNLSIEAEPGVIFVLKQLIGKQETRDANPMYPYYIAYVSMDGTVKVSYVHAKKLLDIYKKLCSGEKNVVKELTDLFNQETEDGYDMSRYSKLLDCAVNDIIGRKNEAGIMSLFSRGGTTSQKSIGTPEDFEIVTFLVVR